MSLSVAFAFLFDFQKCYVDNITAEMESIARPLASLAADVSAVTAGALVTAILIEESCLPKTRRLIGENALAVSASAIITILL